MRDFDNRKVESGYKDPYNSSARPWGPPKTSAQIIKKIDLKYGDHVADKMDDPKEAVLAAARRPSAVTSEDPPAPKVHQVKILIYLFLILRSGTASNFINRFFFN